LPQACSTPSSGSPEDDAKQKKLTLAGAGLEGGLRFDNVGPVEMAFPTSTALAFAALLAGAACSSNDPIDAPRACRDFLDAWCSQNAACQPASERARYREDCQFVNGLEVDCSETKGLSSSYDTCMDNIARTSCDAYVEGVGLPFPPSCKGVLVR